MPVYEEQKLQAIQRLIQVVGVIELIASPFQAL
jgi:hypothetical protein